MSQRLAATSVVSCLSALLVVGLMVANSRAAATPEQAQKLRAAEAALNKAESLNKAGKATESAAAFDQANKAFGELASVKELSKPLELAHKRLVALHDDLEVNGAAVSAVSLSGEMMDGPEKPMPTKTTGKPNPRPAPGSKTAPAAAGDISFTKQIAPMLVGKCGNCHVTAAKGQFSMSNFASLKRGSKGGAVVLPGKGKGSRIVEVIESGDMPRGGGMVGADELAMLTKWIDQGAKYDGKDETEMLTTFVAGGAVAKTPDPPPMLDVVAATGKEEVLFSRDIAPVIAENCMGCHGTQQNPPGRLRLNTFKELLIGGDSGLCVQPGKGAESLIVKKLKGTAGDRMPKGKPPLSDAVIAKFEKWIALGAKFDGNDPKATMDQIAGAYVAATSTHEQLAAARADRARKMWRLALPETKPAERDSKNFFIMSNAPEAMLEQVATVAEQAATKIGRDYAVPESSPLVKGKITLFVLKQRFDYSEFVKMIEERTPSNSARGHFRYNVINAYGVINPSASGDYSLQALVGQQVGGLYIASVGRSPRWFAEGAGVAIGLQMDKGDPRLGAIAGLTGSALSGGNPTAFMNNALPADENDAVSYGFVKMLGPGTTKFKQLLRSLRQGQDFDSAFGQAYRGTPTTLATQWAGGMKR